MGLDIVELLMEVEQEFDIKIPDADARTISTVGDLINYVRDRVRRGTVSSCATSRAFYRFRSELIQALPLSRSDIHPRGDLALLIPESQRRNVWRQLYARGIWLPRLDISPAMFIASSISVVILSVAFIWFFQTSLGLLVPIALGWLAWSLTRPWAVHLISDSSIRTAVLREARRHQRARQPGTCLAPLPPRWQESTFPGRRSWHRRRAAGFGKLQIAVEASVNDCWPIAPRNRKRHDRVAFLRNCPSDHRAPPLRP